MLPAFISLDGDLHVRTSIADKCEDTFTECSILHAVFIRFSW